MVNKRMTIAVRKLKIALKSFSMMRKRIASKIKTKTKVSFTMVTSFLMIGVEMGCLLLQKKRRIFPQLYLKSQKTRWMLHF